MGLVRKALLSNLKKTEMNSWEFRCILFLPKIGLRRDYLHSLRQEMDTGNNSPTRATRVLPTWGERPDSPNPHGMSSRVEAGPRRTK